MRTTLTVFVFLVMTALVSNANEPGNSDDYTFARAQLVREIESDVRATRSYLGKEVLDASVIAAMAKVPRHEFVPEELRPMAYLNQPLPIGHNQTISQPYIVAIMTDLLGVAAGGRVLEVGTGSGYQAAVLGELCDQVYSIEIIEPLGLETQALLEQLGYTNVHVKIGDGYAGWPEHAPFDGIIVTAAAPEVPQPLIDQLKPGGRMIIPVTARFGAQKLLLIEKDNNGDISREDILPVRFVPLTGDREK
jgi:protein-L-isoaspartate(D-aspartate) O-methyltransferase